MSACGRAKTARERANIAAQRIRAGWQTTRAFDDCFEMSDGDEVARILWARADKQPAGKLAQNIGRYITRGN